MFLMWSIIVYNLFVVSLRCFSPLPSYTCYTSKMNSFWLPIKNILQLKRYSCFYHMYYICMGINCKNGIITAFCIPMISREIDNSFLLTPLYLTYLSAAFKRHLNNFVAAGRWISSNDILLFKIYACIHDTMVEMKLISFKLVMDLVITWTNQLLTFLASLSPWGISKNGTNIIWTSIKDIQFSKITGLWGKKWDCHAHFNFEIK